MAKSSRSKQARPDTTDAALLLAAEAILDVFFDDPDSVARYRKLARGGGKARATQGETDMLGSMDLPDDGEAKLNMHAGSPEITVTITHPRFETTVAAQYDPGIATMTEGRVTRFEGDRKKAGAVADKWFDELNDLELDEEELGELFSGADTPFDDEDDPGEPPPPSSDDKAMVEHLASLLAREMKKKKPNLMAHSDSLDALEGAPQSLWPILDGLVAACTAEKREDHQVEAWVFLLESQLTLIRYRIDRDWDWASRMAGEYQQKLIEIGEAGQVDQADFGRMANALVEAGIAVDRDTRVALADAGLPDDAVKQVPDEMLRQMRGLMDQMASFLETPFDAAAALNEATRVMPSELRCFMAHEFARSPHAVLRDTVPLLLLAEEPDIRQAAAAALEQTAAPDTASPAALRRMIAVRNWLPDADRSGLDRAIREARVKGVECAAWPAAQEISILATMIDGSGAQSLVLTSPGRRKGLLAGLLLKLTAGVADSWCHIDSSRRDIDDALTTVRRSSQSSEVDRQYFDVAVQHAIARNTTAGQPPGIDLLRIAELVGGSDWRDRRLDVAAVAQSLFDALPAAQRSPDWIELSLAESGGWTGTDFGESWFLDDAQVRSIVKSGSRGDAAVAQRLIAEVMPAHRANWAERFLLLALRARAAKDRAQKGLADHFAILAHVLCTDRDLADIPLMVAIVRHTIEIAQIGRR